MVQVVPKEVSPVNIHPADKDVSETFMNIMEILERTRETRQILDRNIDSVLRNAEPLELEELEYTGSLPSSHVYFKKLVDSYIETVSADIKRDHFIAAEKHVQFMKPERDTNVKPTSKPQGRPHLKEHGKTNPQRRPSMTAPGETNPQRRPRLTEPGKTKPKVNVPEKKTQDRKDEEKETGIDDKSWKPVPSYMDDSYIERVYGKVVRTSPRRSKFVTPAMKSSRKKAIPEPTLLAKAVSVASSATQTAAKRIPTPRDKPMAVSAMQLGHSEQQFPAIWRRAGRAVALGAPRMGGNAFAYVEMTQVEQPSPQSTRSEPQHHGSSSFEEGSYSSLVHSTPKEQENSFGHRPPKSQLRLQSKQLSSKDDETREARDKGGTKSNVRLESVKSTNKVDQLMVQSLPSVSIAGVESRPIREDVEDTKDETLHSIDEESLHGEGIALPGSRGRVTNGHYPGPVFPPQLVSTRCVMPSSSQLAATISRRDLLENRAAEWIEQEVMSRMIMSMHAPTPVGDVECQPRHGKVDEDISINSNQSGLMDALGQDGLQLFVDSGQPVDPSLVCSLVKEVLQEQLADMLGSRSESHTPSLRIVSQTRTIEPFPKMAAPIVKSPVATPQPTPKTSPRSSPLPAQSLQTQTPIYTPEPTIVEPASSESSMISEPVPEPSQSTLEQSPIAPPSIIEPGDRQSTLILHYDVTTPEVTPPPSPDQVVQATPAVSEGSPTPAQSPKPWGDPDSPMSEEGRDTMHGNAPVEIFQPLALAVAIQDEEPEILVMPPPQFNSPKSPLSPPPAPPGDHSTITVSSLSSPESAVSDTVNQSLSQGEWLSQRSEGEMRGGPPSSSMASTLQGTEEITQDGSDFAEDTISEGQVVPSKDHKETNPVVSILAKMYQSQGMPVTYAGEFPPVTPVVISGDKAEETSPGQVVRGDMTKQSPPSEGESRGDHPMSIADLEETVATPAGRLIQIEPVSDTRQPSEETQRGRGDVREDDSTRPTHTHNRYDSFDPRILTPDQMNMDVLLQSGYLSQTFSTEGGATAELIATDKMGPLQHTGMTRTLGSTGGPSGTEYTPSQGGRSQDFLRGSNQRSFANQSFNSTGKSGKTETLQSDQNASFEQSLERDHDGALTLTMDSLDQDDAGLTHIRPDLEKSSQTLGYSGNSPSTQMRGTGPLTVSIKMPSLHGTELTDTESDDISEYSMGD